MELTLKLPKDSPAALEYEYLAKFREKILASKNKALANVFACYVYTCAYKALIDEYNEYFEAKLKIGEGERKLDNATLSSFKIMFDLSNIFSLAVADFKDLVGAQWARWDQSLADARGTRDAERLLIPFLIEHGRFSEKDLAAFLKTLPEGKRSTPKKVLPFLLDNQLAMAFKSAEGEGFLSVPYYMSILFWQYDSFLKQMRDPAQLVEIESAVKDMLRANTMKASAILEVLFKEFDARPESVFEKFLGLLYRHYSAPSSKKGLPEFIARDGDKVALRMKIARLAPASSFRPKIAGNT